MRKNSRFKKRLYTSAVALGLAVGSVGVAAALTGSTSSEGPTDNGTEIQNAVPETVKETVKETATITADEAASRATDAVSGDVLQVELGNEDGTVVYSVEINDRSGNEVEVKVDAGDGTILDQESGDQESGDEKAGEADNENDQHENENEGQNEVGEAQGD